MLKVRQDRDAASYRPVFQHPKLLSARKSKESLDSHQGRHYLHHVDCHDRRSRIYREFILTTSKWAVPPLAPPIQRRLGRWHRKTCKT
jgi:hypothetical protein